MHVAQYGNLVNNGYKTAKYLRQVGVDCDLVLSVADLDGERNDPRWEDETIVEWPPWIRLSGRRSTFSPLGRAEECRMLCEYDLVHARCEAASIVQFLGVPYIAQSLGADLSEVAFERSWRGALLRRAYRNARAVLFNNIHQRENANRLGLTNAVFSPNPLDVERFSPGDVDLGFRGRGLICLAPARQDWTDTDSSRRSMKGNDRVIRAFAKYLGLGRRGLLILQDRGVDRRATRALVTHLGLDEHVAYTGCLRKTELVSYLRAADVVLDQFTMGCLGGTSLEVMSCAKPLVIYVNDAWAAGSYPAPPPVLNAQSTDDILARLVEAENPQRRVEVGSAARDWILRYHAAEIVSNRLVELYKAAIAKNGAGLPALV